MALQNITTAQFKANLEAPFVSGIAEDLKVANNRIAIMALTTSNGGGSAGNARRRVLSETVSAIYVAFKVNGEAFYC